MANMTLSIPDGLKKEMENFPELNWSSIARSAIAQRIEMLKRFREFTKDSTVTQDDALTLGRELNSRLAKRSK
jgi:hypothetical protein